MYFYLLMNKDFIIIIIIIWTGHAGHVLWFEIKIGAWKSQAPLKY